MANIGIGTIRLSEYATSSALVDLSAEMRENIEKLKEDDDALSAATKENRTKIETLETDVETLRNENHHLKTTIDALMNLTVAVPYEEGYLRAIGATRNVKLYDWWQQNVNKT